MKNAHLVNNMCIGYKSFQIMLCRKFGTTELVIGLALTMNES